MSAAIAYYIATVSVADTFGHECWLNNLGNIEP